MDNLMFVDIREPSELCEGVAFSIARTLSEWLESSDRSSVVSAQSCEHGWCSRSVASPPVEDRELRSPRRTPAAQENELPHQVVECRAEILSEIANHEAPFDRRLGRDFRVYRVLPGRGVEDVREAVFPAPVALGYICLKRGEMLLGSRNLCARSAERVRHDVSSRDRWPDRDKTLPSRLRRRQRAWRSQCPNAASSSTISRRSSSRSRKTQLRAERRSSVRKSARGSLRWLSRHAYSFKYPCSHLRETPW